MSMPSHSALIRLSQETNGGVCNSRTALSVGPIWPFDSGPPSTGLEPRLTKVFWLSTLVPAENWLVSEVPGAPGSESSALGGGTRARLANRGDDDGGAACCCVLDRELDLDLEDTGGLATGDAGADFAVLAVVMADERSRVTSLTARGGGGCDLRLLERLEPLLPLVCMDILATMGWTREGSTFH